MNCPQCQAQMVAGSVGLVCDKCGYAAAPAVAPVSGMVIEDVNGSVWTYVRGHYRWRLVAVTLAVVVWEALIVGLLGQVVFDSSGGSRGGRVVVALALMPLSLFFVWLYRIRKKFEAVFLKGFAEANGYSYEADGTVDETYGTIFRLDDYGKVSDVIRGTYRGCALRLS